MQRSKTLEYSKCCESLCYAPDIEPRAEASKGFPTPQNCLNVCQNCCPPFSNVICCKQHTCQILERSWSKFKVISAGLQTTIDRLKWYCPHNNIFSLYMREVSELGFCNYYVIYTLMTLTSIVRSADTHYFTANYTRILLRRNVQIRKLFWQKRV